MFGFGKFIDVVCLVSSYIDLLSQHVNTV